jgi:hypothetical protein
MARRLRKGRGPVQRPSDDQVQRALELFRDGLDQLLADLRDLNRRLEQIHRPARAGGVRRRRGRGGDRRG